jgi:hypothetical protein
MAYSRLVPVRIRRVADRAKRKSRVRRQILPQQLGAGRFVSADSVELYAIARREREHLCSAFAQLMQGFR